MRLGTFHLFVASEQCLVRVGTLSSIVIRPHVRCCRVPDRFKHYPIRIKRRDGLRKRRDITNRRHQPRHTVGQNFTDPAPDPTDDRHQADAHRLQQGHRHTFPPCRQHEHVVLTGDIEDFEPGLRAEETNT